MTFRLITSLCVIACTFSAIAQQPAVILLDGAKEGRRFEGIGALSAGASSRLLIDYPEPQRAQILDLLFSPNVGAAFQHFKVEIGGDVNSTDGTEPSHQHTRDDQNYQRGYEWWLMKEARKRNPQIMLDALAWGAPHWIGDGNFFSQDCADYLAKFLLGARREHGLDIGYLGIWNESRYEPSWIKVLRTTLDRDGLKDVKIVGADQVNNWGIIGQIKRDAELAKAVDVVGVHYVGVRDGRKVSGQSSADAIGSGRVLWASEDGPWRGDWTGARLLAQTYNLNYIHGKCVKTIIWSLITSYWDNLPLAGSGVMRADEPWSGFYEVQPALWATAHTTQFTQPGWVYLDGNACGDLPGGGSCVALKSPGGQDYSVIIETIAAKAPQSIEFRLAGLPDKTLSIWRSTEREQFVRVGEIAPKQGAFSIELAPEAIYTLSTTTGQRKGGFDLPPRTPFPATYRDDFEKATPGQLPRLFTDRSGVFEVARRADGKGNCVRQVVPQRGIEWVHYKNPHPQTYLGDHSWENYEVKVDTLMRSADFVEVSGRIAKVPQQNGRSRAPGYWLQLHRDNTWIVGDGEAPIECGQIDAAPGQWHELKLSLHEDRIAGFIDGTEVAAIQNDKHRFGQAGFGCGWGDACFDNFGVVHEPRPANLALWKPAIVSSQWQPTQPTWLDDQLYDAASVTDGRPALTRWSAAAGQLTDQWIEIDFGQETSFDRTVIRQYEDRISAYRLQRWDGAKWIDIHTGGQMGIPARQDRFDRVRSSRLRLWIDKVSGTAPASIWEIEVYDFARPR